MARTDGPCWNADPGLRLWADATCMEEHTWAQSKVCMQSDNNCVGKVLGTAMQVFLVCNYPSTETYDMCNVHRGNCTGVVGHITLANCWQILMEQVKNAVKQMMH